MKIIDTKVPTISDLCHPYESSLFAGLAAHLRDIIEMKKPRISDARWAESVKIAIDLAIYPPISCITIKKPETKQAIRSFFIASLLADSRAAFLPAKLMGVLAGSGVP